MSRFDDRGTAEIARVAQTRHGDEPSCPAPGSCDEAGARAQRRARATMDELAEGRGERFETPDAMFEALGV